MWHTHTVHMAKHRNMAGALCGGEPWAPLKSGAVTTLVRKHVSIYSILFDNNKHHFRN